MTAQTGLMAARPHQSYLNSQRRKPNSADRAVWRLHYWICIAAVAVLIVSQFGEIVFTFGDHYLAEPIYITIIALICLNARGRECFRRAATAPTFLFGTVFLVFLLVVGGLVLGDWAAAYADFRCCEALLVTLILAEMNDKLGVRKSDVILDLVIVGLIASLAIARFYADPLSSKANFGIMLCPIGLYLSARKNSAWKFGVILALSTYAAIISFYRTYWVIVAMSGLIYGALMLKSLVRKSFLQAIIAVIATLGCVVFLIQSQIVEDYFYASEDRYIQSIGKTNALISAIEGQSDVKTGDDIRLGYFQFFLDNPERALLPKGLGSKSSMSYADPYFDSFAGSAYTGDSGYYYMVFHFGVPISAAIVLIYLGRIKNRLRLTSTTTKIYVIAGLAIAALYLCTVGDLFVIMRRGVIAGGLLGMLTNRRF